MKQIKTKNTSRDTEEMDNEDENEELFADLGQANYRFDYLGQDNYHFADLGQGNYRFDYLGQDIVSLTI